MDPEASHLQLFQHVRTTGQPVSVPTSCRPFLERRFRRDLGHIRIFDGPLAARAAARLGARAVASGSDIVFGAGQYRPGTAEGLQLLAHEITHACQSPIPGGRDPPHRLGRTDDPAEAEAERVAAGLFSAAPVEIRIPDEAPVCRRVLNFNLSTAGIDVIAGQAVPQVTLFTSNTAGNRPFALFNLTNGSSLFPDQVRFAFTFGGHVTLVAPFSTTELATWKFGFIQFMEHKKLVLTYLGRSPDEGHIIVDVGKAAGTSMVLDQFRGSPVPFFMTPGGTEIDDEVLFTMGDHPLLSIEQKITNAKTGNANTLFKIDDDRRAVSIFVGIEPNGKTHHFAHLNWALKYNFEFRIVGGELAMRRNGSSFKTDPVVQGAPPDNATNGVPAALLANPKPPIANDLARAGLVKAFAAGNFRTDAAGYPVGAPDDFVFKVDKHVLPI